MKAKQLLLTILVLSTLACNAVNLALGDPPTATPTLTPTFTPSPTPLSPSYIPPECADQALATVPAATALAKPTPVIQANPAVAEDEQLRILDEIVNIVEEQYVYPNFNGLDWPGLVESHRQAISAGVDTETFYKEIQSLITELGDEHSNLQSPVEVSMREAELAGAQDFVGVGVYVLPQLEKNNLTVLAVFPNSPAEHGGLKPHDSILSADGIPLVEDETAYPQRVRGPQCSAVVLTVQSPGQLPRQVMMIRQKISGGLPVDARLVPTSDGSRIGYIFLPTFYDRTIPDQVRAALENFGPLDGLILDNRMNGGGSSDVVEPILSFFTSGTLGRYASRADSRPLTIEADPIHNSQSVPLVVLVGENTVSYGEVFAGVLQDFGRAFIVGQTTLGNVEILHGYTLRDGSQLWIAQETFVPANSSVDWEVTGIIPALEAFADWDTFVFETDPGIAAALKLLGH